MIIHDFGHRLWSQNSSFFIIILEKGAPLWAEYPAWLLTYRCRPFPNIVVVVFLLIAFWRTFDAFGLHWGSILDALDSMLNTFVFILVSFGLYAALKNDSVPKDLQKIIFTLFLVSFVFFSFFPGVSGVPDLWGPCFDFFRFWIVLKWISKDLRIDLGIVLQPNWYHPFPFGFLRKKKRKPKKTQPHNPQPHKLTHPHPAFKDPDHSFDHLVLHRPIFLIFSTEN